MKEYLILIFLLIFLGCNNIEKKYPEVKIKKKEFDFEINFYPKTSILYNDYLVLIGNDS